MDVKKEGRVTLRDMMRFFRAASPPTGSKDYGQPGGGYNQSSSSARDDYYNKPATSTGGYGSTSSSYGDNRYPGASSSSAAGGYRPNPSASSQYSYPPRMQELRYRGERYMLDPISNKVGGMLFEP